MVEVIQQMRNLYGLYMVEAWKTHDPEKAIQVLPGENDIIFTSAAKNKALQQYRFLKVQGKINTGGKQETHVPEIKLSGKWLSQRGFKQGQQIKVTTEHQKIIIEIVEADEANLSLAK